MPAPRKYSAPAFGDRFGYGVIIGYAHFKRRADRKYWDRGAVLLCDCGAEYITSVDSLHHGVKSCGCKRKRRGIVATPGYAKHPLYHGWHSMVSRCTNPDYPGYKYWGGWGISVCDKWTGFDGLKNFVEYVETVLGPKPSPGCTVDRIDNDGDYEPGNVRWATRLEQTHNRGHRKPRQK